MSAKHEKWVADPLNSDSSVSAVYVEGFKELIAMGLTHERANRLVSCWNVCESLTDPSAVLEIIDALKDLFQSIQGDPAEIYRLDAEFSGACSAALRKARIALSKVECDETYEIYDVKCSTCGKLMPDMGADKQWCSGECRAKAGVE